ncbi:hypothetical protein K7432_005737 [Basidiobolus ranarum]|uniref:PROP1-like PPR domain-containing protein n=1 Tax=Basidiobolus ranarum TaxID=34480 RepID=A0ABR2WW75_9FUNG
MVFLKILRLRGTYSRTPCNNLLLSRRCIFSHNQVSPFRVRYISSIAQQQEFVSKVESTTLASEWSEEFTLFTTSKNKQESLQAAGNLITLLNQSKPTPFWKEKMGAFYEELDKSNFQLDGIWEYGRLIRAFNKLGMLQECEKVICALKRRNWTLNRFIYNNYIELVGKTDSKRAFALYERMLEESVEPSIFTYNILLHSSKVHGNLDIFSRVMADLTEASVEWDLYTYSILISAYIKTKKYDHALKLYNEMVEKDITPDASIFTALINLYTKKQEISKAVKIYEQMLQHQVIPDVVTYSSLISLYSKKGNIQKMREILQSMLDNEVEPNVVIYSAMIDATAKHSSLDEAKEMYQEMVERNIEPNAVTLQILSSIYINENQLGKAVELYNDSVNKGCTPDVVLLNNLIRGSIEEDATQAQSLYNQMKQFKIQPNIKTFNLMIGKGYTKLPFDTLMNLYQDMQSYQIKPDSSIYYSLLRACRSQKKTTLADSLYLEMIENGVPPNVHSIRILMELHSRSKNYNQTLKYYEQLKKWNLEPDSNIYALVFKCYNYLRRHDDVLKLWNHIQLQGYSKEAQLSYISSVLDSGGFASDVDFLTSFWDYVKRRYPLNSNHFASLMEAWFRIGDSDKAKNVFFKEMAEHGVAPDVKICQTLITQLKNHGSPQEVVHAINFIMRQHPHVWAALIKQYH